MVGGTVIEALAMRDRAGRDVIRLWCMDRHSDECAVYADPIEASDVRPGDRIWWQSGKIYWTRDSAFTEREIRKISYSFDPRRVND